MSWTAVFTVCAIYSAAGVPNSSLPTVVADENKPSPRLVLTPNRAKILQRDNLLVRVVFDNPSASDVKVVVEPPYLHGPHYFRLELLDRGKWRQIYRFNDEDLLGQEIPYSRTFAAKSTYAEYNWIQTTKGKFYFETPGKYELRGVAATETGEIKSAPVTITVTERPGEELKRTTGGPAFKALRYDLHPGFVAMKDLSGNSGATIRNFLLVQEFARSGRVDGKEIPIEKMVEVLKPRMDDVSWEYGLNLLGKYLVSRQDAYRLQQVVVAMPYESDDRRFAANHLDSFLRRNE